MSKEELLKYLIAEIDLIMHDKDYRFENANGTWYSRESCRDLTNEEVFEELRTELRQFADLEAKLAESEKKAYSRGHSQRDIANEIKLNALREDVANKEKRIVELKQQLAEKDLAIENWQTMYESVLQTCHNDKEEIERLNKQLAEKEKEMSIKSIIRTLVKYNNLNCTFRDKTNSQIQQCGDVYNSNYGYFNFEDDYDECLNNRNDSRFDIISIDLDNQDKISFAVEQLEKIINLFEPYENEEKDTILCANNGTSFLEYIDNQINELKGKVEDEKRN